MAAEVLAGAGLAVDLYDAMPSVGRKFLLAGKGGLNLTHAEPFDAFLRRYGARAAALEPMLRRFGPVQVRDWAAGLGVATFVGTSKRVFPVDMKAAPLLRAWLHRLRAQGLRVHVRHRWTGIGSGGALRLATPAGELDVRPAAVVLATGGGSWRRLGSDGAWVPWLREAGVDVAPLRSANCGFDVGWSAHLRTHFAGRPLKTVAIRWTDAEGRTHAQAGEFLLTETGVEGSLVYAASAALRDRIERDGQAGFEVDLLPARSEAAVAAELARPRGGRSLGAQLKSRLRLDGAKSALLHELTRPDERADPQRLAACIKALPVVARAPRPIDEAISSAGGVRFEALDDGLMLRARPGVFCAGEMLDWEAPTGGYLLTACLASGYCAGLALARWLGRAGTPDGEGDGGPCRDRYTAPL
jgi:hypothetical protein